MSIEAMKQALDVLAALDALFSPVARDSTQRVWIHEAKESIEALRTAIQQAEAKTDEPSPTQGMNLGERIRHVGGRENAQGYIEFGSVMAVSALIKQVIRDTHPAPGVPEFSRIAKRKLDELQEQGFAITGYAIQRGPVRGFIDGGGFVGWWQGEPAPGVPDKVCGKTCNCAVQCGDVYAADAERFRTLMRAIPGQIADAICGRPNVPDDDIIEAIDLLAASPAQKGQE